MIRIQQN